MSGEEFISKLDKQKSINKLLWRMLIVEAVVILLLAIGYFSLKETVRVKVELPAKFIYKHSPVVLAGIDGANEIYYKMWAEYITEQISSFNEYTIKRKLELLFKTFDPKTLPKTKSVLMKFAKSVQSNLISQKFTLRTAKIVAKREKEGLIKECIVETEGIAKRKIGENKSISKSCVFKYKLAYTKGVIYVEDFYTNCF